MMKLASYYRCSVLWRKWGPKGKKHNSCVHRHW